MAGTQRTAYQQNLSTPLQQQKELTAREIMGDIYQMAQYNPAQAQEQLNRFMTARQDSRSQWYDPYSKPTNQAASSFASYGIDIGNIDDEWFNKNRSFMSANLIYDGTSTTPTKPTKKATQDQLLAYDMYQWWKSEDTTKKAEQEWEALQEELSYWAKDTSRNYSDQEILKRIDWSKYKTLASMNENRYTAPTELNRRIDFSEDAMYGVLWAARNPEYEGDLFGAMANSVLGTGYQWQENPEITARLDASNPDTYAPYTVGSTMDEVCVYYNQPKFTKEWLLANKPDGSDETATKMWNRAWKAEEFTEAVEEEANKADEWLSRILVTAKDPEAVLKVFDNKLKNDWKNLKKLDDSLELVDSLYDTTRAVRYDYKDYKRIIEEQCAINRAKDTDDQVIERAAGAEALSPADVPDAVQVASPAQQAANQAADARLQEIAALVDDDEEVIPMLQDTIDNGWSVTFDNVYNAWDSLRNFGTDVAMYNLFGENRQEVLDSHADRSLANLKGMYDYEILDNNVKSWKNELAALETKVGGRQYANQVVEANKEMLVEVDGETYRIGLVRAPGADGNDTYYLDWADWIKNGGEGGVDGETFDMLAQNEAVGDLIRKNNLEAILIEEAKKQNLVATEEDQKDLERMRELELRIEDGEIALADDKDNYQRQQAEFEKAQHDRDQAIFWMKAIGMDTTDLEKEDAVVSYLADFADYEATVWAAYSPSAVYRDAIEAGQSVDEVIQYAEQGNQEVLHELEREEAVLKYLDESGLKVPANYRQNLERSIAKLKRDVRDFDYFKMSQNSDFDEIVRKGKEEEYQNRPQQWSVFRNPELDWSEEEYYAHMDDSYDEMSAFANYGLRGIVGAFINQMTDYEKDTYYYLMGQGKKDEAMDYIQSLTDMSYGVLHTRLTEDIRKRTADAINHPKSQDFKTEAEFEKWKADHPNEQYDVQQDENGYHVSWTEGDALSFIGVNLGAIITSPFAAMASLGYMGYRAVAGGELNPYNAFLAFNNFRSSTREESAKAISDFYGEGTAGQKVVQMFYDILSNRLDSAVNAATFGWIGGGIGNEMLAEFIGASPMGISAAMDAMSEVKRRGGTDAQAWGIGLVTFLTETGTEAISLENIKGAFHLGKEINAKTVRDFLKKWLTQSGISEMLGETGNDILGNLADDLIMGELSNHKELVWSYRMKGYEKEDAEAMALMDGIKNLAYTALTSYLSPGADIATYAASRGAYYLSKTNKKEGISILDVLREEKDNREELRKKAEADFNRELKNIDMEKLDAELEYRQLLAADEERKQNGVENGEGAFILPAAPRQNNQAEQETAEEAEEPVKKPKYKASKPTHDAAKDYSILQTVKNASQSAQSATIASVINVSRTKQSALTAMAAAMRIQSVIDANFSEQESYYTPKHLKQHKMTTLEFVENMLLGSEMGNVDAGLVKQAIQNAALAENSDASILVQSDEFWAADYDEQASMLAATVPNDRRNQNVLDATARSLHDYRVSQAVKGLVQNGLLNAEENAKNAVNDAKTVVDTRQKALKKAKEELKAKTDTLKTINEQNNANPSAENEHLWDRALNEYKTANDNAVRAEQELKDARKALKDAEAVLKSTKRDSYKDLYQQAEEQIAQEDQQEAEQKRIQEEQAKIEEEKKQAAEQERLEKEELRKKLEEEARETENFVRMNAEEFVDNTFKGLSAEDRRYAINRAMRLQREMSGDFYSVNNRKSFARAFAKKFGLKVQYTNDTWYNARIDTKTGTMMVSKNATQSDMMYAIMVHELTHMAEQSDTYNELANTVLQMKYGEGMTWDAILAKMNSGDHTSKLAQDILARKAMYDNRLQQNHSYEDILQEFVADGVGYIVSGDQAAVDRLVAEKPSLARRILESIKNFLKKIAGVQGETLTQAQNVVDMLENALKNSEKQSDVKHSLNAINEDYMDAAENGDLDTAQQYVDEYAKKKGYTLTTFHGTGEYFNTFKRGWEGIHLGNPEQAGQAADTRFRDRSQTTDYRWGKIKDSISQMDNEQRESLVKNAYLLADYMSNSSDIYPFDGDLSDDNAVREYAESIVNRYAQEQSELDGFTTDPDDINIRMNTFDRQVGRRVMKLYAKINNPFLINGDVNSWTPMNIADVVLKRADGIETKEVYGENVNITGTDVTLTPEQRNTLEEIAEETGVTDETWDALSDVLNGLGFDGIQYMNTYEGDRNSYSYIALKQSDIKLADAVTRDDNGNIIPLDERFNQENDDIRYSMTDNVLAEDDDGNALATELFGGTVAVDTERFSLNSFNEEEQERVRQALLNKKDANGKRLFTKKQVDKYMDDALGIAKLIATDKTRWDFEASDNQVFLKPNNDYYFTLDASTLCAKRLLYQGTFDYVQHALPDEVFTPEDLIDLVNIMNEMGYETPCGICYVESRRRWLDTYAQRFLDTLPEEGRPSIDDLTTSDGLEKLRHSDPDMYKAFVDAMNKKGTANPKVVQLRTEYRGDIGKLTANDIQKVKDIGGLRIQSFSDFETPHLLDMMQAVLDMSARGLTSQAYTKVPNFAWVFGDTGIKINLSLIGKGTGLDENGNLVFDNREGINFDEAMKLRERYNKNVGTILVGINDDHIIAAMGDPRIDFIIPFHKSGWSKEELRKMPTLNNYEDYTATQNERYIIGRNKDGSYETESFKVHKERTGETLENFQPVGKNGYWNFKKSGQWNAENYLKMCAEQHRVPKFSQFLVDNGDGSFSLPKGKDKRSTSIREGYWKTLTDFKMYENDGYGRTNEDGTKTKVRGSEQREVTPNINMEEAYRVMNDYKLGRQMPDKADGTKGAFLPMENNNSVPIAVPAAEQYIELIRQRRGYTKPAGPGPDTLEADLPVNPRASAFGASRAPAVLGNTESESTEATTAQQNAMAIDAETGETVQRYSLPVTDPETLESLNEQEKNGDVTKTYRTMKLLNGKLYSPKATYIQGELGEGTKLNEWEMATEDVEGLYRKIGDSKYVAFFDDQGNPIDENADAYFKLDEKGRTTYARYNPYMHSSNLMLNDQFSGAYEYSDENSTLGKLVTVECLVPNSEIESGYKARYAKDPVGWTNWKAGVVAQQIADKGGKRRNVFLSRYIKPVRIVSDSDVAKHYKELLDGTGIKVPANVVTPSLLSELEKVGVEIGPPQKQQTNKYRRMMGNRYSLPSDAPYLSAVNHGDMDTAQKMVDEKAKEAGYNIIAIHGTNAEFNIFEKGDIGYHFGTEAQADTKANQKVNNYGGNKRMIRAYIKMENPLVLDFDAYSWDAPLLANRYIAYLAHEEAGLPYDESETSTKVYKMFENLGITDSDIEKLRSWDDGNKYFDQILERNGYDGIIYKNEIESNEGAYSYIVPLNKKGNIKAADPVTYRDDGVTPIPLSERFNTTQPDIRYSLPSDEMLDEQYRYYMENQQQMGETEEPFFREQPDTGMKQRQFGYDTIQRVEAVRQEVKDWLKKHSRYRPQTNEQQVDRAVDWVMGLRSEIDPDGFWGALNEFESGNFNPLTADGQARMYVVMSLAANKNDVNVQKRIADAINKQGTSIGRALQARKLYRLMSPAGRVAVLQKEVDNMNAQLESQGKKGNITLDYWTQQLAAAAQTEEEFQKVQEQMWKDLGAQLPVTMFDRLQAWRMVSMLGNPRTHIRNIVGNWAFRLPVFVKNKVGAGLESIFIKDGERTKALRIDRSLMDWIDADAERMQKTLTGEGKYNDRSKAEKYKQPFGKSKLGKVVQKWADYSSTKLEEEDWWFLKRHYKNALGNWMTANKVTGEMLENDEGLLDSARAYAIQEAQKATYRDANKFAEWLSKGDRIKGVRFLTTTVMPFKKTPLNIMKRGLEYSPLGFLKTIAVDSFRLAEYQKWASGKKTTKADWALSPAQYIDKFSAGLTGVGIAGLGALLTSLGCLKLGFKKKDPEDQFEQAEGKQEYSLNLELFGHDLSYTIDWLAPSSMPLFVGAAMMEAYQDNELDVGTLLEDLGTITEPIWNLSMVDGITSIFDTSDYDDTNKAMQIIMKIGMNYVNSFVPTAVGQFSRAIDPTRRKSYVKSGDKPSTVLYEFEKLQNKTPFSVWNIPYRDHRGNIDRGNVVGRAIQNMVSPGYFNDKLPDASLKELHRLYTDNKTNENVDPSALKNLAPSDAPHYFSVKGQTIRLTAEQYDQLDYETKQIEFDLIDRLLADPYYADLDDAERISMINDINTFATQQAKFNQFPEFKREDWVSRAVKNGIDPLDVIKNRSEKHVVSSQIDGWTSYLLNHIEDGDMEEQQRAIDSLMMLDPDTDIDKIVKNGFVSQYQKAYKDGDDDTMVAIRMMLEESGFIFDYDDWLKNTVKKEEEWMEDYQ